MRRSRRRIFPTRRRSAASSRARSTRPTATARRRTSRQAGEGEPRRRHGEEPVRGVVRALRHGAEGVDRCPCQHRHHGPRARPACQPAHPGVEPARHRQLRALPRGAIDRGQDSDPRRQARRDQRSAGADRADVAPAPQTAKATEEISAQIAGMQTATQDFVGAIKEISGTINRISEITRDRAPEQQARDAGDFAQFTGALGQRKSPLTSPRSSRRGRDRLRLVPGLVLGPVSLEG